MISFGEGIESRAKVIYFTDPEEFFRRNLSRTTSRSPFARGGFCIYCLSQNYFRTFGFLNSHLMDHKKISLFAAASAVAATLWLPSFFSGEKENPTERSGPSIAKVNGNRENEIAPKRSHYTEGWSEAGCLMQHNEEWKQSNQPIARNSCRPYPSHSPHLAPSSRYN